MRVERERTGDVVAISGNLRGAFDDLDVQLGETYVAGVDGEIDPLGGVIARVDAHDGARRVLFMPSLRDTASLTAACACAPGTAPCEHVWAVLRAIDAQRLWPAAADVPRAIEMTEIDDPDLELISEGSGLPIRRTSNYRAPSFRFSASPAAPLVGHWRDHLRTWPVTASPPAGKLARVEYVLDAIPTRTRSPVPGGDRTCVVRIATTKRSPTGPRRAFGSVALDRLGESDAVLHELLFGVEVKDRTGAWSPPECDAAKIARGRAPEILSALAATERLGWLPEPDGDLAQLSWDGDGPWLLEVAIVPDGARTSVAGALVRGDRRLELAAIDAVAGAGIVIAAGRALEVAVDAIDRWLALLVTGVSLARAEVPAFIEQSCCTQRPPQLQLGDVGIEVAEEPPTCRIIIEPTGGRAFVARAELAYRGEPVDVATPSAIVRDRRKRVVRRRLADEHAWTLAVRALDGRVDREWQLDPARLRTLVEAAAARGIATFYAGQRVRSDRAFTAIIESGIDWFDLSLGVDADDADVELPELLAALRANRPLVRLSDGTTVLIPPWLEAKAALLTAAPMHGGALRFRRSETLVLAALVAGAEDVDADAPFVRLRGRLEQLAGMTPCDAPRGFGATLRSYQREGLGWLRFLRELGMGGCLADDMGLGKTVQVLALLEQQRRSTSRRRSSRKPSLVVAPLSLVFHWLDESRRFAPKLVAVEWHGTGRGDRAAELASADLVITTYGTLRADLERFAAIDFAYVVLDEAHAIKNATTATAKAARHLRADHRLALTGTPVENRLDDLASIFDFLNPGLLGRPAALRALAAGDGGDARAQALAQARSLGQVLRPFMLRRTKDQVLMDLPPKTDVVVTCRLDHLERRRYEELRDHYRRALLPAVERDGVGRSAIQVLEALLRLRQAALHPGLLDARRGDAGSAKLDALVERLHGAIASGHRALVFSQFTTLLDIAGARLTREGIAYEYLDGATRDRRERVHAFQTGSTPVFLISLKAGGVGLNLTAADHVFLLDPWWNPAVESQAIDRVHRIGQDRPVTAYRLIAEDTVESKILELQAHKRALFDSVFADAGAVAGLTVADLRALLES